MRKLAVLFATAFIASLIFTQTSSAAGLKVAPLGYRTTLKKDERKTGFIDVSNPSMLRVKVTTSFQAFRQINNDGGLQFYDDKQINAGLSTDLKSFTLGPREALRLYFTMNGKILPEGDVYAAVFFTSTPSKPTNGVGQQVRVGTLLSIINRTPGSRAALVTGLNLPFVQLSDSVLGEYKIKNTGASDTGFYPVVRISSWPGGQPVEKEGSLVFGGRERTNDFTHQTGPGIHLVEVAYGDSKKSQWVIALPAWLLILIIFIVLIITTEIVLLRRRRKHGKAVDSASVK